MMSADLARIDRFVVRSLKVAALVLGFVVGLLLCLGFLALSGCGEAYGSRSRTRAVQCRRMHCTPCRLPGWMLGGAAGLRLGAYLHRPGLRQSRRVDLALSGAKRGRGHSLSGAGPWALAGGGLWAVSRGCAVKAGARLRAILADAKDAATLAGLYWELRRAVRGGCFDRAPLFLRALLGLPKRPEDWQGVAGDGI